MISICVRFLYSFSPVGMPRMERVFVQNLSPDTSIHMLSISGNTLHTHCSFFQDKVSKKFPFVNDYF